MSNFRCWIPDYGQEMEDAREVVAWDAEQAAELFIENYESRNAEYPVASGETVVVAVSVDGSDPELYSVWGEAIPSYQARRVQCQTT